MQIGSTVTAPALEVGAERSISHFVSRANTITSQPDSTSAVAYEIRTDVPSDNLFLSHRAASFDGPNTVGTLLDIRA